MAILPAFSVISKEVALVMLDIVAVFKEAASSVHLIKSPGLKLKNDVPEPVMVELAAAVVIVPS